MPNVNFTSSSIAQQDIFAQTTVSYESRNMQSIPFYPDVDHKTKLRGIMALTLVCTIIGGAILGLLFGFRDVIFDAANTGSLSALFGKDDADQEASVTAPAEEVEFSLAAAASTEDSMDLWNKYLVTFNRSYSFVYDGDAKVIPSWDSPIKQTNSLTPPAGLTVKYAYVNSTKPNTEYDVLADGWPTNAGTYYVYPYAEIAGSDAKYYMPQYDGKITLTIAKATPEFPGINHPVDGTVYSEKTPAFTLTTKEDLPYGIKVSDLSFKIELKRADYNGYQSAAAVKDAGLYRITLSIKETANTKAVTFNQLGYIAEFEIKKAEFPSIGNKAFKDSTVTFDGKVKTITINTGKNYLPSDFPTELTNYIKANSVSYSYEGVEVSATNNEAIHAGTYRVSAYFNHYNYEQATFGANLVINKATLSADLPKFTKTYDGKPVTAADVQFGENELPDTIYVVYSYSKGDDTGLSLSNIVNAGTYTVTAKLAYINGAYDDYTFESTITKEIKINKATLNVSDISISPVTDTYTGKKIGLSKNDITFRNILESDAKELKNAIDVTSAYAINAGTHTVYFSIGAQPGQKITNYNALTEIPARITIKKASFGNDITINALANQSIKKDGKPSLPVYSYRFNNGFEPQGDVVVDFFIAGNHTAGVEKLGTYKIDLVISDDNHEDTRTIEYTIAFNPMTIVMGIVFGIVFGILLALLIWASFLSIDKKSYEDFKRIRARIQHERGGPRGAIVCEGRVSILNFNSEQEHRDFPWVVEPRFGRLFLTHATLEFYDSSCHDKKKRIKNYRNFLVQLKEVTGVEIRGVFFRNKLIVFAKGGRYVFYVEPNTAYLWRRDILHFRDLAHLYPMENNVVDNDYPFNYAIVKGAD